MVQQQHKQIGLKTCVTSSVCVISGVVLVVLEFEFEFEFELVQWSTSARVI